MPETPAPLSSIDFVNDGFLAVGWGGTIVSSSDGIHWSVLQSHYIPSFSGLAYGNGTFVAPNYWPQTRGSMLVPIPRGHSGRTTRRG